MRNFICAVALLLLWSNAAFAGDTHYQLEVDGMVCPFCFYGIEKKLGKLDGVTDIETDFKNGRFSIDVTEGVTLSEAAVRKAVTDAGFTVRTFKEVEEETDK